MSRARLGLYVFGRVSLFENCLELKNTYVQCPAPSPKPLLPNPRLSIDSTCTPALHPPLPACPDWL
jgi:hypothetical protein